jgi:hypothetical protein
MMLLSITAQFNPYPPLIERLHRSIIIQIKGFLGGHVHLYYVMVEAYNELILHLGGSHTVYIGLQQPLFVETKIEICL